MPPIVSWGLVAAVVALEIPYPLVHGTARDALTVATVVVFAVASIVAASRSGRWWHGLALLVTAGGIGFAAEVAGVHTGIPFGSYSYTGGLGAQLFAVPVVVPLAWVMMAHPAAVVARRAAVSTPARIAAGTVALAAWDVFLDPQMVAAGHWRWADPDPHLPGVHGVPLTNFGGWLLVSLVVMAVLQVARIGGDVDVPATTLWAWTWLSSTLANFAFFGRPAVAAWGFAAMGVVGVPMLRAATR